MTSIVEVPQRTKGHILREACALKTFSLISHLRNSNQNPSNITNRCATHILVTRKTALSIVLHQSNAVSIFLPTLSR